MNYYNENNPKIAAWLRELIEAGLISNGFVDQRSVEDVQPKDLEGYQQCHFFAGIGGWSYALRLAGWPDDEPVWTASLPCQPFSAAGKRKGKEDERHLWPVFAKLIEARRPAMVIGEQVASKDGRKWLTGIFSDLEGMGYQRAAADLCAAGTAQKTDDAKGCRLLEIIEAELGESAGDIFWEWWLGSGNYAVNDTTTGAPHIRQRIYWVAYSEHGIVGREGQQKSDDEDKAERYEEAIQLGRCCEISGMGNADEQGSQGWSKHAGECGDKQSAWAASEPIGRMEDSKSKGLERPAGKNLQEYEYRSARATQWSDFEIVPCRDEKTRRIERGTFPLVDGSASRMVPSGDPSHEEVQATSEARIVRLQGYGNAIVPQLAAEFILAAQGAISDHMKISQQEEQTD